MSELPISILKQPALKPAEDFYGLRRAGIGFIEQMGSRLWTDYNTHDPGITILEALCYAITDLAYRTGWDIKDLLAPPIPSPDPSQPFPNQSFFSAREILTGNPWTPDDFRRLLIDRILVRNAWVFCKECACDVHYYAWCENDLLMLSFRKPPNPGFKFKKVEPLGLYEVLLELENDQESGDLNDRKIEYRYNVFDAADMSHSVTLELRFPEWGLDKRNEWTQFLANDDAFAGRNGASFNLDLLKFNRNKEDGTPLSDADLRKNWRNVFFASFEIELLPGGEKITVENVALRIFGDNFARNEATVNQLEIVLKDKMPLGVIQRYRNKLIKVERAVEDAKASLYSHRNLGEDYCSVRRVGVEEVAVCADVEVAADADIEWVQAKIWFEIEEYFNPPVPSRTLQELLDADVPVEEIFNGPELDNGFIEAGELQAAGLKTTLRTSDIINRLADIEGVMAVNNLLLSRYDDEGKVIKGNSDSAWLLLVTPLRQPRLYHNLSRFLFYKNGLPLRPRIDEAYDTLTQLRGEAERPKQKNARNDLPVSPGVYRNPEDYFPVQYSFPLTYGIGMEGLPSNASPLRRGQARQMKAYLMVFEQLLGNGFAQIAHAAELFSLDPSVRRTYFVRELGEALIQGYAELVNGLSLSTLEGMVETVPEFQERRNRFLDHIMARFGEQFGDYALLLRNSEGQKVAPGRLIEDKISFLRAYPRISHDRGKAFDYKDAPCEVGNTSGLKKRISLLLGYPDLAFYWTVAPPAAGQYPVAFQLKDKNGKIWLEGNLTVGSSNSENVTLKAGREIILQMTQADTYDVTDESRGLRLKLKDKNGGFLGQYPTLLQTRAEAKRVADELLNWSSNERAIVVEHLLLRPKFPGDALYPACTDGACETCGGEDPYSFRLTFVMPGWTAPYNLNMELRRFADRTIHLETPSHLLGKTCWVGNDGFIENPCDPVIDELAGLLITKGRIADGGSPNETDACNCADAIYSAFSKVFKDWYGDKTLVYVNPDALETVLKAEFGTKINAAEISCTTVVDAVLWAEIQLMMIKYFHHIAQNGWQFERFEDAWCKWLDANAVFDWTEERLQERVEAILERNRVTGPVLKNSRENELCKCAASISMNYGTAFYNWMDANFKEGNSIENFTPFSPDPVNLCAGFEFKPGTTGEVEALLTERYTAYKEVSYRLRIVVNLLGKLRNTYPGATLHDCDDGSDQNPVRLGSTALGSSPLPHTLSP